MPDLLSIGAVLAGTIVLSLLVVTGINWSRKRPDLMQPVLEREPMFGKDFHQCYYSDLPRNVVFEVRTEFARVMGVPADFVRPEDELARLGVTGGEQAMTESIALLFPYVKNATDDLARSSDGTLDGYIRSAAALYVAQQLHSSQPPRPENEQPAGA